MDYADIVTAAWRSDPAFVTLCKGLYGPEATPELVAKMNPAAPDLATPGKRRKRVVLDMATEQAEAKITKAQARDPQTGRFLKAPVKAEATALARAVRSGKVSAKT